MSTFTSAGRRRALPVGVAVALVGGAVVLLPSGALAGGNGSGHGRGHHADRVIFINGDGMAAAHRKAARLDQAGFDGEVVMDRLPVAGLQTTDPRDPEDTVTDSAAAATAWTTGQ
jgi:alkaline phosphatase